MLYFLLLFSIFYFGQKGHVYTLCFYNTENFFDAKDNPYTFDDDYTPEGRVQWTNELLEQKTHQLAQIIGGVGKKETRRPPLLIGLSEIENHDVLKLLVSNELLSSYDYGIVHFDSPDYRGIDVALLYQEKYFTPVHQKVYHLELNDPDRGFKRTTRDILVVSGYLSQHYITILVNHWPSRRGGTRKSAQHRFKAALLHKKITDSLFRSTKEAYIISMGDFNDNPSDKSLRWIAGEKENRLFNPMKSMAKKGLGSLAYNDRWHLFDQLLHSTAWTKANGLVLLKTDIYAPSFLRTKRGKFQGYPFRTKINGNHLEGFSDHFPVYAIIGELMHD